MGNVRHGALSPSSASGIHVVQHWSVANAAALAALTLASADIGKVARQVDTNEYFLLINNTGPVWAKIPGQNHAALSILGRAANSIGAWADIVAAANDRLLTRVGNAIAFTQLTLGMIPDGLITAAKLTGVLEMAYTASVTASRNIALTDAFKAMLVDSTSGAVVITFVQDSTVDIPDGQSGFIRWTAGGNQVSVAQGAGATVNSSGTELKLSRLNAQIYWEKTAANTYFISGEKMA